MATIPEIEEIRSFSRFGLSVVTIVFKENTDIYWSRQQVSERLITAKSQLPEGMGIPELGPLTTGLGEIYQYVLRTKKGYEGKFSLMELRTMQDWIVRKQLLGTPGVADVSSFGGAVKQFEVSVNPELLKQYDLSVNDIYTALNDNNQNAGGAYIEHGPNVLFIRTEGMVDSLGQIGSIPVKTLSNGMPLLISDIAEIKFGEATKFGATTLNADGLAVSKLFPKGTLVITIAATIGAVGILDFDSCMPDSLVGITPYLEASNTDFIYYSLLFIREHLKSIAPQVAQANLKLSILQPLEISLPSLAKQKQIASTLTEQMQEVERLKQNLKEQLDTINKLPAVLLRRAFNGEL